MRKLKVKDRRRQQKCHKKRKNVSKFSWAWIIKTVTKLRERERRIACLVFTSYIKCTTVHSIRKFQAIVVQWRQRIEMRRNVCRTPLFQSRIGMFFFSLAWIGLPSNVPWLGIIAKKIEKTKIHFYATFSPPSLSSNLKVPVATKQ